MKILVTGGAGFIGSHIVDRYVALGHDVAVVDDLSTGKEENVNPKARFYRQSILDDSLADTVREFSPDVVNHQAAQVNVRRSVDDPLYDARVNVLGAIRVFQCAVQAGCRKVIYASSGGACYGEPAKIPAAEDTAIMPLCPYGAAKYAAEKYLELFGRLYDLRYTILRYANVYGPRQDPHGEAGVVAIFAEKMLDGDQPDIFGDGSKTRDYVYVADIVEASALALKAGDGGTYNVGLGVEVTDDEVFRAVRDAVGVGVEARHTDLRKGEVLHIALDASRLRAELGWKPKVSLEEGMARAVEYYRAKRKS